MNARISLYRHPKSKQWRWTMYFNKTIVGASTEGYVKRSAALMNLYRVTGLKAPLDKNWRGSQWDAYFYDFLGREYK